jgi:hypothetical protein
VPLTDLEWLRRILEDVLSEEAEAATADGESREFRVANPPIAAGTLTVFKNSVQLATPADYLLLPDARTIRFATTPNVNDALLFKYANLTFDDAELLHYLAVAALDWDSQTGRVYRAAVLALDSLLTGAATSLRFGAGSEERDLPSVFDRLAQWRAMLAQELAAQAARPALFDPGPPAVLIP